MENVFNYPGLGKLMREAVMVQDYPLIQGIFLLVTLAVLSANFMADLVYRRLDPRVSGKIPVKTQRAGEGMNVTSLSALFSRMTPSGRAGTFILGAVIFLALAAPLVCSHSHQQMSGPALIPPGPEHIMGTDELGVGPVGSDLPRGQDQPDYRAWHSTGRRVGRRHCRDCVRIRRRAYQHDHHAHGGCLAVCCRSCR